MRTSARTRKEIQTLPVGPVEVSAIWYAQSRLAFSTLGIHVWAQGVNEMHTVLSRVMDKSCEYPLAVLWDLLKKREDALVLVVHFVLERFV